MAKTIGDIRGPDFTHLPLIIRTGRRGDVAASSVLGLILGAMGLILWVEHDLPRFVSGFFIVCAALFLWLPRNERQRIRIADGVVRVTERRWYGAERTWEEPYFAFRGVGRTRYDAGGDPGRVIHTLHLLHPDDDKALVLHESRSASVVERLGREAAEALGLPRLGDGGPPEQA